MKKEQKPYYVLTWEFNDDSLHKYDVMPYFVEAYKKLKPGKRPNSVEEFKGFVEREGKYMFWSRCQYEIVVTGFPSRGNDRKIDVWYQIEMNLDTVVEILIGNLEKD